MVRGIERFKAHFAPFADRYVLIGVNRHAIMTHF